MKNPFGAVNISRDIFKNVFRNFFPLIAILFQKAKGVSYHEKLHENLCQSFLNRHLSATIVLT